MKTKIQIKTTFGRLLFEFEKEDNSVKDTLIEAVKRGANLVGANLVDANLVDADLRVANLVDADLGVANLRGADLGVANLVGANLKGANLKGANLGGANLGDAYLRGANLRGANLVGADLRGADLRVANLVDANLGVANLRGADLGGADLGGANLVGANLGGADLRGADIGDANLVDANLVDANLRGAYLRDAKNVPFFPTYLPEGEFIAWKKLPNGLIAKLKILEDSKRSRAAGDKCRCDKCLVLEFQNVDGSISDEKTYTSHEYAVCTYTVGEVVRADKWDDNRWVECSHGIHFFIDRQSAVDYRKRGYR
jgi:hypothetical protein